MNAIVTTYKPPSGPIPSIPLVLSSGTAWYGDSYYTAVVPFDTRTHAFGRPIPDPTAIPDSSTIVIQNASPKVLEGAPLAPLSLARGTDGHLWGVGYAEKRLGLTRYASSAAIVEYDPAGSSRAFSIPAMYEPGPLTVRGPDGRPWSMIWNDGTKAAVVQLNANGSMTPKFTIALSELPAQYGVQYARFGAHGIVWLFSNADSHPEITRWILGSHSATHIALPARGPAWMLRCDALTTTPDGSAWVVGQEIADGHTGATYFYRVSPAGAVTQFPVRAANLHKTCPGTIFAANGSVWAVATVDYGPHAGTAYLLRVDRSGKVAQTAIAGARGALGPGRAVSANRSAYLSSSSGALPELTYNGF